jgi:hypothetical protein
MGMQAPEIPTIERRLRQLLASHATVKIATASPGGDPWIATAYFAEGDSSFSLMFMLERSGRTLANMTANPRVAVMLENGDAMALFAQGEGTANVVNDATGRFRDSIAAKTPASAPLVGLGGLVPVRIEVTRWRLTDVPGGWLPPREILNPRRAK